MWGELRAPERIEIAAQQKVQQIWLPSADAVQVRSVEIALEAGASCTIFALNTASEYGRIALDVTLADEAHFALYAANIGGGNSTLEIVTTVRHIGAAATSRQTVRCVLGGKATGSYVGKVAVARDRAADRQRAIGESHAARPRRDRQLQARARDLRRRRQMRARRVSVGELDPAQLFYAAVARARPGRGARLAARRLHRRAVGRRRRRASARTSPTRRAPR